VEKHIEYIFAGGPLHGQTIPGRQFNEALRIAPSFAGDATPRSPRICASYRHANSGSLRVAAKHRRSNVETTCYIVLHPQAMGEQFLTIFAA
jgi:hypothetical protein